MSALAIRGAKLKERLSERVKNLDKLREGKYVVIYNQTGNYPCRRDKTGVVIKDKGFDQYHVMTHRSRRTPLRNRKFLWKIYHKVKTPCLIRFNQKTPTTEQLWLLHFKSKLRKITPSRSRPPSGHQTDSTMDKL